MVVRLAIGDQERPRAIVRDAVLAVAGLALVDHVEGRGDGLAHRRAADDLQLRRLEIRRRANSTRRVTRPPNVTIATSTRLDASGSASSSSR